ncbi:meiosis specific with OB domains [Nesidiocoris tenuis]|nr:meiosis specific with OB domains [Nesidiocoris tenuis]
MSNSVVTKRMTIAELRPNLLNVTIVAVLIGKRRVFKFPDKNGRGERAVCGFTIRDSKFDFVNLTVWGSFEFVENLSSKFNVGDVVQVVNPKVGPRRESSSSALFEPPVTSFVELTINEETSQMIIHPSAEIDLMSLVRVPTKPPSHFMKISDIKSSGRQIGGQLANLLAAVQWIGSCRKVTTRKGDSFVQDVRLMDRSSLGFIVSTWEQPIIDMIAKWKPRETCLFLADIRIKWSDYYEEAIGLLTSRSIVTVDPDTPEARELADYAAVVPIQRTAVVHALAESVANPDSITTVMSCDAILERCSATYESSPESFTALLYAVVEVFDLDGPGVQVVKYKCLVCGDRMREALCLKSECQSHAAHGLVTSAYDIRVTFVDHTNALENCRLKGSKAEQLLGISAEDFAQKSSSEKIELKWKFLLKKVAARLVVLPARANTGMPLISIVVMEQVSLKDFANGCPMR